MVTTRFRKPFIRVVTTLNDSNSSIYLQNKGNMPYFIFKRGGHCPTL